MFALTKNILTDFFETSGWAVHRSPPPQRGPWSGVRLYYPGCELTAGCLYVADGAGDMADFPRDAADLCLLGGKALAKRGDCAFVVEADCGLIAFYTAIQAEFDRLMRWDRELSELLLSNGTLQEILDCSAPILRNPCMFQDDLYCVLAHSGEATVEDNPLYYETVKLGRAPNRLFEKLLSMPAPMRMKYKLGESIVVASYLSPNGELMANCTIDGIPVLRFLMVCTVTQSEGLRDLVAHLLARVRTSPYIQEGTRRSSTAQDMLFSRLIENPADPENAGAIINLGLHQYDVFCVVAIDFHTQAAETASILFKYQLLHPQIRFFMKDNHPYALLGGSQKENLGADPLSSLWGLLKNHLNGMGARYGVSHNFNSLSTLGAACAQAAFVLNSGEWISGFDRTLCPGGESCSPVRYSDVMLTHMVTHFFNQYSFDIYCPPNFRKMLDDDQSSSAAGNVRLLYTYLANQCNATSTSRLLHMHRNNVIYRINKLQTLYGFDLDDSNQRTLLLLCCMAVGYLSRLPR